MAAHHVYEETKSTTAPIMFHQFLERMRQPSAHELVRSIKTFIAQVQESPLDVEQDSARVQNFMTQLEATFRTSPLWRGSGPEEVQAASEGLEKYLMTKLYPRTFAMYAEDRAIDAQLNSRLKALQFIKPENLDIPRHFHNDKCWQTAQKELQKMNQYKAPRDKMVCILNCCRVVSNALSTAAAPGGADDLLPVLIYVTIKAQVPQLHSNLQYVLRFRMEHRLRSEAAYYFTNLVSAAYFLRTVEAHQLTDVDPEYFRTLIEAADAAAVVEEPSPRLLASSVQSLEEFDTASVLPHAQPTPDKSTSIFAPTGALRNPGGFLSWNAASPSNASAKSLPSSPAPTATSVSAATPTTCSRRGGTSAWGMAAVEAAGARMLPEADARGELALRHRFLYAAAGDLRVADVDLLLMAYKELVLKYEGLRLGVESALDAGSGPDTSSPVPVTSSRPASSTTYPSVPSSLGLSSSTAPSTDHPRTAAEAAEAVPVSTTSTATATVETPAATADDLFMALDPTLADALTRSDAGGGGGGTEPSSVVVGASASGEQASLTTQSSQETCEPVQSRDVHADASAPLLLDLLTQTAPPEEDESG